ncbi:hypothetical protein EST38_g5486 [Candolleomyces aberdarensis]|uniref:Probable pectate lyase F n=1 Tax=Candolleomyces aberdarensis TaxID=2316362 RepID=A0A4Q2DN45_9AGAR|nr:hypothetical protein EST38_g5486 [Candolleomyces aberdarensis]
MLKHILVSLTLSAAAVFAANPAHRRIERRAATNVFPTPPTTSTLSSPITVKAGQSFTPPQAYTRYERGAGTCGSGEGGQADAVFILEEGATLNRVVIGKNQMEGVHCLGQCTINYVFFEDVCEDAITIKQTSGVSRINFGGAKGASDKIVQHNGGGKVIINSFYAENFGKLYRSCGNCKTQYKRSVEINDSWAVSGLNLVGINSNFGDTATIRRQKASNVKVICQKFTGNNSGKEPSQNGSGPDSAGHQVVGIDVVTRPSSTPSEDSTSTLKPPSPSPSTWFRRSPKSLLANLAALVTNGRCGQLSSSVEKGQQEDREEEDGGAKEDPLAQAHKNPNFTFHRADLSDFNVALEVLKGCDAVIHLAGAPNPGDYKVETHNMNVVLSWNVLRACAELGITRIAQASSVNVLTMPYSAKAIFHYFPIDENHPCEPDEPYGLSKVIMETQAATIVRRYPKMRVASLRLSWSVPHRSQSGSRDPQDMWTAKDLWGYVHEESVADAFLRAVSPNLGPAGGGKTWTGHEAFFITAPEIASLDQDSKALKEQFWKDVPVRDGWELGGTKGFFDCSKAKEYLGWVHRDPDVPAPPS